MLILCPGCSWLSPQGALRVSRFNPFEGWVGSESVGEDILISGRVDMNRAFDGEALVGKIDTCSARLSVSFTHIYNTRGEGQLDQRQVTCVCRVYASICVSLLNITMPQTWPGMS